MSKIISTLNHDDKKPLTRRRFLQLAAAGSALAAAATPDIASAARVIYRPRHHHSHVDHFSEIDQELDDFQSSLSERVPSHPSPLWSSYQQRQRPRDLALYVEHTGEKLAFTYYENGQYLPDALSEVNLLLRDQHNDDVHSIDPTLLDQLYQLRGNLGISRKPIHVLSAYRSPATNARLRRHSRGVASKSLHMSGRAIDIRIEGVRTRDIRNAALAMAQGGVGYYPHSNFVHMDTGSFRTW